MDWSCKTTISRASCLLQCYVIGKAEKCFSLDWIKIAGVGTLALILTDELSSTQVINTFSDEKRFISCHTLQTTTVLDLVEVTQHVLNSFDARKKMDLSVEGRRRAANRSMLMTRATASSSRRSRTKHSRKTFWRQLVHPILSFPPKPPWAARFMRGPLFFFFFFFGMAPQPQRFPVACPRGPECSMCTPFHAAIAGDRKKKERKKKERLRIGTPVARFILFAPRKKGKVLLHIRQSMQLSLERREKKKTMIYIPYPGSAAKGYFSNMEPWIG